ncbi:putative nuclease HARBI1 [Chanodichthys erythropterus]|uniref:putative nuclease HARBI1 n=1 Tax=Chanodichthys erythropterus TaxID=933992 RepID=UPI00351F2C40
MACPFLRDVVDEEALVLRRAFRRERVFRDRLDPLAFPDDHLYERYRFSADGIRYLCRLLGPRIKHRTARSHALSVEQMVCVALRFFASGAFLYSVGDAEQLNKATICRKIRSVCLAIKALADVFISFPGHRRLCDMKEEFYRIAGFPNVIGAVDCTHIRIKAPSGAHEADFVNRKSFHSINVQMVCNADCVISNVVAKWPGSVHDSRIFRASEIYQCLSQGEFSGVLLGDRGYGCQPFLLTPFTDPQEAQQAYNHAHARTRARVEMTFGLLKARFHCLHKLRIERLPHGDGRTGMFSPHQETLIVDMVRENNAIKLSEIQQKIIEDHVHFEGINSVSLSTVDRVLKRNRLRMKQLYRVPFDRNSDRVKEQRFQYVQRVFQLDAMERPHEYIYMDEAGFNLTKRRRRGRNVIGHRAIVGVPGQRGGNVTLCAAIMPTWGPTTLTSSSFSSITCEMLC